MRSIPNQPTQQELEILQRDVRERITHLQAEIKAHGMSGRMDRRAKLLSEVKDLERKAGSITASIKQLQAATRINKSHPSRTYSQQVER